MTKHIYKKDVMIWATAYVVASSEIEAKSILVDSINAATLELPATVDLAQAMPIHDGDYSSAISLACSMTFADIPADFEWDEIEEI